MRESWGSDQRPPPLTLAKTDDGPLWGPFFFLFQRGLARPSDFRRLVVRPKSFSERPAALSTRLSTKSRRIQKQAYFQVLAENRLRCSLSGFVCSRCEQRHPKAAWLCALVRTSGRAQPTDPRLKRGYFVKKLPQKMGGAGNDGTAARGTTSAIL